MCIVTFNFFTALGVQSVWEQYHYTGQIQIKYQLVGGSMCTSKVTMRVCILEKNSRAFILANCEFKIEIFLLYP